MIQQSWEIPEMLGKHLVHICPFACLIYCCICFECHVYSHSFVFDFCVVLKLLSVSLKERQLLVFVYKVGLLKTVNSATEWVKLESLRKFYMT